MCIQKIITDFSSYWGCLIFQSAMVNSPCQLPSEIHPAKISGCKGNWVDVWKSERDRKAQVIWKLITSPRLWHSFHSKYPIVLNVWRFCHLVFTDCNFCWEVSNQKWLQKKTKTHPPLKFHPGAANNDQWVDHSNDLEEMMAFPRCFLQIPCEVRCLGTTPEV